MLHDVVVFKKTLFTFASMTTKQFPINAKAKLNMVQKRYGLVRDCILE